MLRFWNVVVFKYGYNEKPMNFSFRKEQKRKKDDKFGQRENVNDQVRRVLASAEQSLILMVK